MEQIARKRLARLMLTETNYGFFFSSEKEVRRLISSPDRSTTPEEVMDDISNMCLMGGEL